LVTVLILVSLFLDFLTMSSLAKALFEHHISSDLQITRIDSPKITQEKKSSDFDTTSVRSPVFSRRSQGKALNHIDGLSPAAAERAFYARFTIENDHFAKGAYGKVDLAFDKMTKEKVAIKRIPKTTAIKMIQAEVKAGQLLGNHPNIATFNKYYDFGDHHSLIFQFIDGEDLFNSLESSGFTPMSESVARNILLDVVKAIQHTHSKNIAHRDIKLENILLDKEGRAFLIDFGLCAMVEEGKLSREWCGSDNYLSPQIVRRIAYDGFQADVFSLGVVAFALLFGVFPFECLQVNSKYSNDPRKPLPRLHVRFPSDVKVSREAKHLLVSMLEDDPDVRITIDDILKHSWITGVEESALTRQSNE